MNLPETTINMADIEAPHGVQEQRERIARLCIRQLRQELNKWQDPQKQREATRVRRGSDHKYVRLIAHYEQQAALCGSPNEAINLINSLRSIFAEFEVG